MRDAECVEMAHHRFGKSASKFGNPVKPIQFKANEPVPIDIGNLQFEKLSAAERDQCRKEGRCFRCRGKGHMAIKCPNGEGNRDIQWDELQSPEPLNR